MTSSTKVYGHHALKRYEQIRLDKQKINVWTFEQKTIKHKYDCSSHNYTVFFVTAIKISH